MGRIWWLEVSKLFATLFFSWFLYVLVDITVLRLVSVVVSKLGTTKLMVHHTIIS